MSIVKNTTREQNKHFTVQTLSTFDNLEIRKYLNMQNAVFQCKVCPDYDHTVLIMAEIPSGTNGYFFGKTHTNDSSKDFYIKVEDNVVKWKYKGNPVVTHPREDGVHIYGYVGGKPVYDYQALSQTAATGTSTYYPAIGAALVVTGDQTTYSYIPNINIYCVRVQGRTSNIPTQSTSVLWTAYYPAAGHGSSSGLIVEPMGTKSTIVPEGTRTASMDCVTYGVQLDDIRYLTGSGYRDLLALVCEDGGADAACGWTSVPDLPNSASPAYHPDAPYSTHNFAFNLTGVPIVDGTGSGSGVSGELIQGRKPIWSIWNNSVKHGFYVHHYQGDEDELRFNIFRVINSDPNIPQDRPNWVATPVCLEWFNGYNTDPTTAFSPMIEQNSALNITLYNAVHCECENANKMIGSIATIGSALFHLTHLEMGSISARIGNTAPWNISNDIVMKSSDYAFCGHSAEFKIEYMGGYWSIAKSIKRIEAEYDEHEERIFNAFSSSTSASVRKEYQQDMTTVMATLSKNFAELVFDAIRNGATESSGVLTHTLSAKTDIKLLKYSAQIKNESEIDSTDTVSLNRFLKSGDGVINGTLKYGSVMQYDTVHTDLLAVNAASASCAHYGALKSTVNQVWGFMVPVNRWAYGQPQADDDFDSQHSSVTTYFMKFIFTYCNEGSDIYNLAGSKTVMVKSRTYKQMDNDDFEVPGNYEKYWYRWNDDTNQLETFSTNSPNLLHMGGRYFVLTEQDLGFTVHGNFPASRHTLTCIPYFSNVPIICAMAGVTDVYNRTPSSNIACSVSGVNRTYQLCAGTDSTDNTPESVSMGNLIARIPVAIYDITGGGCSPITVWTGKTFSIEVDRIHYENVTINDKIVLQKQIDPYYFQFDGEHTTMTSGSFKCQLSTSTYTHQGVWRHPNGSTSKNYDKFMYVNIFASSGAYADGDMYSVQFI